MLDMNHVPGRSHYEDDDGHCSPADIQYFSGGLTTQIWRGKIDRCLKEGWCQREYLMPMVTDPILCLPAWADGLAVFCLGAGTQTGFPGSVACTPQTMTACTGTNPSQRCHWTSTLQLLVDIWLCICGGLTELVIIKEKELLLTVPSEWWTLGWIFRKLFLCLGRPVELGLPSVQGKDRKHRLKTNQTATASWEEHAREGTSNKRKLRPPASMLWAAPELTHPLLLESKICDFLLWVTPNLLFFLL